MSLPIIVGIGEILFDIVNDSEELGGAPANFSYHVTMQGARGYIISTIGNDSRGERAIKELEQRNLSTECISINSDVETGYVRATLDSSGIASYLFPENIAWDHLTLNQRTLEIAPQVAGVCFGSLAQRSEISKKEIYRFLEMVPAHALKVFDLNLRQNFFSRDTILQSLRYADILKLNDDELPVLSDLLQITGNDRDKLATIIESFSMKLAMLTRGDRGSLLVSPKEISDHPGIQTGNVIDTIGAGDAFTAATVVNLLQGDSLEKVNEKANMVAAKVCSYKGAMPIFD